MARAIVLTQWLMDGWVGCWCCLGTLGWNSLCTTCHVMTCVFNYLWIWLVKSPTTLDLVYTCIHCWPFAIGSPKMNINTKCKQSPDDSTKCFSVRSELAHIWFPWTKFITDVAYQLNLWQSDAAQATVLSSCIKALPFVTFFLYSNF